MARTRAHDYDDKRRVILKRAADLFATQGYSGASISMIAEACGMSKALVYHYYPDKAGVLFDILSEHLQTLVAVVETAAAASSDPREQLRGMAAALLDAYRDADAEHQVQIGSLKLLAADQQEHLKELERLLVRRVSAAIAGAVPDVADSHGLLMPLTMSLFGMLNWHYLWFRDGHELSRQDYAHLVADLIIAGTPEAAAGLARSPLRKVE